MRLSILQQVISIRNINKQTLNTISRSRKLKNLSANRNQDPILGVLQNVLDNKTSNLNLLEISSGTGQHCAYFSEYFHNITFQPSECDVSMLPSILAYAKDASHKNMKEPVYIDISVICESWNTPFAENSFDYMLNMNMIHISPWHCTQGLFRNASKLLKNGGLLITYGPYAVDGFLMPDSNVRFNQMLQSQNPEWGVRDVRDLQQLGAQFGIRFRESYDMPANNKTLIWVKD